MYSAPKIRRNVFKTEEKKGTEEKALQAMEFPEFHSTPKPVEKTGLQQTISYIDVANKEKDVEETRENKLEEGWCRLSWDPKRKLVIERSEKEYYSEMPKPKLKPSYHEYVSNRMQQLFDKWDEYTRELIEMNGEDAYQRMKPVFDQDTNEEEEDYYEENEDDYYCEG
jgi:hypothetical protein